MLLSIFMSSVDSTYWLKNRLFVHFKFSLNRRLGRKWFVKICLFIKICVEHNGLDTMVTIFDVLTDLNKSCTFYIRRSIKLIQIITENFTFSWPYPEVGSVIFKLVFQEVHTNLYWVSRSRPFRYAHARFH